VSNTYLLIFESRSNLILTDEADQAVFHYG